MNQETVAALRQQAAAVRAQVLAALMAVDALLAALPAPPAEEKRVPRFLGDAEPTGESQ